MKIEAGKFYRERVGTKVGPMTRNTEANWSQYPWCGVDKTGIRGSYTATGQYEAGAFNHPCDLIAEWQDEPAPVSPLVVTRDGKPVEDQAQGIEDFKNACRRAANPSSGPILLDWSATASTEYAPLAAILQEAYDQAATGKGKERHARGLPFIDQPILEIGRMCGPGFNTGQSIKKQQEAMGMLARGHHASAIRELLGAINYAAAAVMLIREQNPDA